MPKKSKRAFTRIYELIVTFTDRDRRLVYHVEEKDRQRLVSVFSDREKHGFYELGGHEGQECLVNTTHISQLNVLDYLGGIEFEATAELTHKQWTKKLEKREASDEPVILRIWLRGETNLIVHHEIEKPAWNFARTCLIEGDRFVSFCDEDGEDVIYGTDHIDAVEMIDPFYLNEKQVKTLLDRYDEKDPEPPSTEPADSSSSTLTDEK